MHKEDITISNHLDILGAVVKTPTTGVSTSGKACSPVNCRGKMKQCPYGYQKKDGCEICKCNDPCNPPGKVNIISLLYTNICAFIRLNFVHVINDVSLIKKLMEHLPHVVM